MNSIQTDGASGSDFSRAYLILIVLAGLAIRAASAWFLFGGDNALFDPTNFPQGDLHENLRQAKEILENGGYPNGPFIHGPLYVYMVAFGLLCGGGQVWPVYVLQLILGSVAAGMIYLAGRRLVGERAARVGGVLAAFFAPSIYYETLLTGDSMILVFMAGMLLLVAKEERGGWRHGWLGPVLIGAVLGGLTLLRANLCLLGVAVAAWMLFSSQAHPVHRRLGNIGIVAGVSIAIILPACIWNTRAAGSPRFVVGEVATIWQFAWAVDSPGYFFYPREYPHAALISPLDPAAWMLAARKLGMFFAWFEFPDLSNFHLYSRLAPPLYRDPVTMRIVSPLALAGIGLALRRPRAHVALLAPLCVLLAAQVLFYISGRYRLAVAPFLFLFAGLAAAELIEAGRSRNAARLGGIAALIAILAIPVNLYDPSRLHSMWHGDVIFAKHQIALADAAIKRRDFAAVKRYCERLLWVAFPDYQIRAHAMLYELAKLESDKEKARMEAGIYQRLRDAREKEPVLDQFGNQHFPPTS